MIYRIAAHYNRERKSWTEEYLVDAYTEAMALGRVRDVLGDDPTLVATDRFVLERLKQPYLITKTNRTDSISG